MAWNLPNILTWLRILAVPLVVVLFYSPYHWADPAAGLLFAAASITDSLDGYLARRMNLTSRLGAFLDPVADKLIVAVALVLLVSKAPPAGSDPRYIIVLAACVILCREILVSGLREYLAGLRVGVPVSRLAKWKTGIQMTAIGFLLVGEAGPAFLPVVAIGTVGLWCAAALTLVTGYDYLHAGLRHLQPGARPPEKPKSHGPAPGSAR